MIERPERAAIVIAAHGSRAAEANDATSALAARVEAALGVRAYAGFLELTTPSIPTAIATAVAEGAATVIVVPYFLHVGIHVRDDLRAIADDAATTHPEATIRLTDAFGTSPDVAGILVSIASRALAAG